MIEMTEENIDQREDYDNKFIDRLIKLTETHNLDFKRDLSNTNKRLSKLIVAMANHDGGDIYLGITNEQPREIVGETLQNVEEEISGILNNLNPRPYARITKLRYKKEVNDVGNPIITVIKVKIHKTDKLIRLSGAFWYRDVGSSRTRNLTYNEIVAFDRMYQSIKNEFLEKLRKKPKEESPFYIHFSLTPSFSKDGYFDLLSPRDIFRPMIINRTEHSSRVTSSISWANSRFNHPLQKITRDFQVFNTADNYTTVETHYIVDHRTGNQLNIHNNGTITGKILFQLPNEQNYIYFDRIFKNSTIYGKVSDTNKFPSFPMGSLIRALSFSCYLLASESDFNWRLNSTSFFQLSVGFCNLGNTKIMSESFPLVTGEFLKADGIIQVDFPVDLDSTLLKIRQDETDRNYDDLLLEQIIEIFQPLESILLPQFHSYYGTKSSIYFSGRRTKIDIPLLSHEDTVSRLKQAFWTKFEKIPVFTLFDDERRSEIPIQRLFEIPIYQKNRFEIFTSAIDYDNCTPEIKQLIKQKQGGSSKIKILGFRLWIQSFDSFFLDELVENTFMSNGGTLFSYFIRFIRNLFISPDFFVNQHINLPENIMFPIISKHAQSMNWSPEIELSQESNGEVFSFSSEDGMNSLIKLFENLNLTSENQIGIISDERIRFDFPYHLKDENHRSYIPLLPYLSFNSSGIPGFRTEEQFIVKSGKIGQAAHLFSNLEIRMLPTYRNIDVVFHFFVDLPQDSVFSFKLPEQS